MKFSIDHPDRFLRSILNSLPADGEHGDASSSLRRLTRIDTNTAYTDFISVNAQPLQMSPSGWHSLSKSCLLAVEKFSQGYRNPLLSSPSIWKRQELWTKVRSKKWPLTPELQTRLKKTVPSPSHYASGRHSNLGTISRRRITLMHRRLNLSHLIKLEYQVN